MVITDLVVGMSYYTDMKSEVREDLANSLKGKTFECLSVDVRRGTAQFNKKGFPTLTLREFIPYLTQINGGYEVW
tara:strand:- start:4697 stop:4921 length:225 start_codon:yes stop_codon:yes gene_type:complete